MKRVILSVTGTVVGIVALLSFKTHGPVAAGPGGLPSAGLSGTSTTAPSTSANTPAAGAPPDPSTSSGSSAPQAQTSSYTGAAEHTRYGIVQVKITVSGRKITNAGFAQLTAFDGRSQQINSGAAPTLLQETLKAQNANINSVSGASYTSQGYIESLQSALDKAGI